MRDKNKKYLSASRIKTLTSCSWLYWCKYKLKLPEGSNDGARRGSVCHLIFDVLGNKRHKKHFTKIIKKQDAFASKPVKRLILKESKKLGVDDEENLDSIKEMILAGLNYDFFGLNIGRPTKAISEYEFKVEKDDGDKKYNIYGFIDKLFLYKNQKRAIVRDFKSSKKTFEGKEISDNLQDWLYCLAVKEDFSEYLNRNSEFIFLKFMDQSKGVLKMESISDLELDAFEYELTEYQKLIDNFDIKQAKSNFAANADFPKKGFSGPLLCGFAKHKGQLKKDGSPMWHCAFKFPFKYISIINNNGEIIKNVFEEDFTEDMIPENGMYIENKYEGCPAHQKKY